MVGVPLPVDNRPGLPSIAFRFGRHADVLASMLARLSSADFPTLRHLRTRRRDDWTIALLDGWATISDVLSFYAERIANEAYLRTAIEHRSVLELARLVGYEARPGVAATAHLSYTLDPGQQAVIPAGSRARSVPGPDEQPQTFETSAAVVARAGLNRLGPRLSRPQVLTLDSDPVYLQGIGLNLAAGDGLLFRLSPGEIPAVRYIAAVSEISERQVTRVVFDVPPRPPKVVPTTTLAALAVALTGRTPDTEGQSTSKIDSGSGFPSSSTSGDVVVRALEALEPSLAGALTGAWSTAEVSESVTTQVWVLRVRAPLFGHNAPPRLVDLDDGVPEFGEWSVFETAIETTHALEREQVVDLDLPAGKVAKGGWAVVDYRGVDPDSVLLPTDSNGDPLGPERPLVTLVEAVEPSVSRKSYGMSGTVTRLRLADAWIDLDHDDTPNDFTIIRGSVVHSGAEELTLAEEPIEEPLAGDVLELASYYAGIDSGRLLAVVGERVDLPGTSGVVAAEVVEVSEVAHAAAVPETQRAGDPLHTYVRLRQPLRYRYRRSTAEIHGNVAHATHGETRVEVLGSGDASTALQRFTLRQAPLTYTSAATASGITGTLETRIDDVRWPRVPSLAELGPADRAVHDHHRRRRRGHPRVRRR